MTDHELQENWNELLNIYRGILFHNLEFSAGRNAKLIYDLRTRIISVLGYRRENDESLVYD